MFTWFLFWFLVHAGTLQQLISDTMVRWAQESVIEDPDLVRAMFVLLHRQYDGIGGQVQLRVCVFLTLCLANNAAA